mmetsp:Transcript_23040/g.50521  ORF Transcript_23040/g.50521 Transcript_23040/m.50521 type:complete len:101 (-) Transcript_23040:122-424(-)
MSVQPSCVSGVAPPPVPHEKPCPRSAVKPPIPPREPAPEACCGQGCPRCVWDVFEDKKERYLDKLEEYYEKLRACPSCTCHVERPAVDIEDLGGEGEGVA